MLMSQMFAFFPFKILSFLVLIERPTDGKILWVQKTYAVSLVVHIFRAQLLQPYADN